MPSIKFYADTLRGENQLFKFKVNNRKEVDRVLIRLTRSLQIIRIRAAWYVSKKTGTNERVR